MRVRMYIAYIVVLTYTFVHKQTTNLHAEGHLNILGKSFQHQHLLNVREILDLSYFLSSLLIVQSISHLQIYDR